LPQAKELPITAYCALCSHHIRGWRLILGRKRVPETTLRRNAKGIPLIDRYLTCVCPRRNGDVEFLAAPFQYCQKKGADDPPLCRLGELNQYCQLLRGTLTVAVFVETFPDESLH
jgi:hypothetical protein